MDIEKARLEARRVFDMWFPLFGGDDTDQSIERKFEFFFSGYLAGTKHKEDKDPGSECRRIWRDDAKRNLDL